MQLYSCKFYIGDPVLVEYTCRLGDCLWQVAANARESLIDGRW